MLKEIEMKVLEVPKRVFEAAMKRIGAKKKYRVFMRVKYFDFPDRRIQKKKDLLRLRECRYDNGKIGCEVVYKVYGGIKRGCKVFEEHEWRLPGTHAFQYLSDFFEKLGFLQTLYYEKKRTLYDVPKSAPKDRRARKEKSTIFLEFDEHPKIPSFFEVEAPSATLVHELLMKLGLQNYEKTPETIEQLIRRKYPKIKLNGLRFRARSRRLKAGA